MRLALLAAALASTGALASPTDQLAQARWRARLVVASAPRADNPALTAQREIFAGLGAGARARDLRLIEIVGEGRDAEAARRRLGLASGSFVAALIGKDGEVKLRAARPLDARALFPLIDAMPMRRDEMRARGE